CCFQAEDGIRDFHVTGVQTCALPISVRTGEEELFKARAREIGSVKIIDLIKARLDTKNDCFVAELPSLGLKDVRIDDDLVRENEIGRASCRERVMSRVGDVYQ